MKLTQEQPVSTTEELVHSAVARDASAFAALIRRYERVVLSVAFSVLSNSEAAADVAQDAFFRAWQRLAELKEPARFATWICGIARNLAIDVRRKNRRVQSSVDANGNDCLELADDAKASDPLEALDQNERRARVAAAVQSLDEVTRPAVILRYYDGLSSKEIAEILGMSPAAVDMRLSRARQQLKKMLTAVEV